MEPTFGWSSLSPAALARARQQMRELGLGVRDEVGFLLLHQRYADRFFPGTSVLHSRLRYALFVPWLFQDQAGCQPAEAVRGLRAAETALAGRLKQADEHGVIGGLVWPEAAEQPVSTVYWSALATWGILRPDARGRSPTRHGVHGSLAMTPRLLDDDGEPLSGFEPPFVRHPGPPGEWAGKGRITFHLLDEERAFLKERLSQVADSSGRPSLLSKLVRDDVDPPVSLWDRAIMCSAGRDGAVLGRAQAAGALAAIGRGVYAALVEDLRDRIDRRETPTRHRKSLGELVATHGPVAAPLIGLGIDDLEGDTGPLPKALRTVVVQTLAWLEHGGGDPSPLLDVYEAAEARKGSRARLALTGDGRARRLEWEADEHPVGHPLHYRWPWVRGLLLDLRAATA